MRLVKKAVSKVTEPVRNTFNRVTWKVARFFATIEVHIYPRSPHFTAHTEVWVTFFNKYRVEAEHFRTPFEDYGHLDIDYVFRKEPKLHYLEVHYPPDWDETMREFHKKSPLRGKDE